jgi:hypothetical protein
MAWFQYTIARVYYLTMIVASFFLLLTIAVYLMLWRRHTLHGWTQLSYFISLLFMNLSITAVFISTENSVRSGNNKIISSRCQIIGNWSGLLMVHYLAEFLFAACQ